MLHLLDIRIQKYMSMLIPICVIVGILLSVHFKNYVFLVPWLFAFMTFEGSLSMNLKALKGAFTHPLPILFSLLFLHIVMPLWALAVGHIVFNGDELTITGLILGMVLPTGITSFIWVSMKKGNTALTLAIILIDALLSPIIVPFCLSLFIGKAIEIDFMNMMTSLLYMIVLPSIAAIMINEVTKGKVTEFWKPRLSPFSKISLCLVVLLNGAVIAPYLKEINMKLVIVMLVVTMLTFTGYIFSFVIAKMLKYDRSILVPFTFSAGMRNISAGSVIAITYFPPAVIVPVVTGMIFQQAAASIYASLLDRHYNEEMKEVTRVSV